MRTFLVALLFVVTACVPQKSPLPPSSAKAQFHDPDAVYAYWGRMVELFNNTKVIDAGNPDMKVCLIDGAMRMTTPEMGAAIERYLSERTESSLNAASAVELKSYRNGILGSQMLLKDGTCASPSDDRVRYRSVTDVGSFWRRTMELRYAGFGFMYAPDPGVRQCHVDSATRLTTPEMTAAINRFLADKTKANMDSVLSTEQISYPDGITKSELYIATETGCLDKETDKMLARLAQVQTRHAFLEEFVRMGSEQRGEPVDFNTPPIVDCLATASEAVFSNAYLFAIDRYIADKTRANWDQIVAAYPPFAPMSSQADLDEAGYACKTKFRQ